MPSARRRLLRLKRDDVLISFAIDADAADTPPILFTRDERRRH
jgi:hypothetical protein